MTLSPLSHTLTICCLIWQWHPIPDCSLIVSWQPEGFLSSSGLRHMNGPLDFVDFKRLSELHQEGAVCDMVKSQNWGKERQEELG